MVLFNRQWFKALQILAALTFTGRNYCLKEEDVLGGVLPLLLLSTVNLLKIYFTYTRREGSFCSEQDWKKQQDDLVFPKETARILRSGPTPTAGWQPPALFRLTCWYCNASQNVYGCLSEDGRRRWGQTMERREKDFKQKGETNLGREA